MYVLLVLLSFVFRTKSEYVERFMPRELILIPLLNHPNIVKVHQVCLKPFQLY